MKTTNLVTFKPINEQLKKLVAYYYIHNSEDENNKETFYFYPNYLHALTIYKGNDIKIDPKIKRGSKITSSKDKEKVTILYTINHSEKYKVKLSGSFNKIGIVFYPLAFNHFIDKPLDELLINKIQEVNLHSNFISNIQEISDKHTNNQIIKIIEKALLSIIKPFNENELDKSIKEIIRSNGTVKISELEKLTGKNRKTLLRYFKKHTLLSIEEYKKMVLFRNSLNYALSQKDLVNLTDVALYNMYFDQSHFIKHFKSVTKETPKTLLPKITQLDNKDLYWYFLEE